MKIQGIVFLAVLFFCACSKKESSSDHAESAVFRMYQNTIDSVTGIHYQIFKEIGSSEKLVEPALGEGKAISGRRLFKTRNGNIAGMYDLWIRGKVSNTYKVLIVGDRSAKNKLFFLKRTDSVEVISAGKKQNVYDVLNYQGNKVGNFRLSELFANKRTDIHLHNESVESEKSWNEDFMMFFVEPTEPEYALCGLCGEVLYPESDGVFYYCDCPFCGVDLIYPPTLSAGCFNSSGTEVSDGGGGSGGGGGGGGGGNSPTPSATVAQIQQYFGLADYEITLLNQNQGAAQDILQGLIENDGSSEAIQASEATLAILQVNNIEGPYDLLHLERIRPYLLGLHYTQTPIIYPQLWAYFTATCAMIRLEHPEWSNVRVYWEATKEYIHSGLDVIGLVPVVGELADLANGIIYTIEGDGVNATLSYAATIPIAGWAATATKYARKTITAIDGSKRTLNWIKLTTGVIEFGDRGLLRKVLGLGKFDPRAAHHIIPWEHGTSDLVQKAAVGNTTSFHMNEALNGIALSSIQHSGSHNLYSQRVMDKLADLWQNNGGANMSPATARALIDDLITDIRTAIVSNPNTPINNIIF